MTREGPAQKLETTAILSAATDDLTTEQASRQATRDTVEVSLRQTFELPARQASTKTPRIRPSASLAEATASGQDLKSEMTQTQQVEMADRAAEQLRPAIRVQAEAHHQKTFEFRDRQDTIRTFRIRLRASLVEATASESALKSETTATS